MTIRKLRSATEIPPPPDPVSVLEALRSACDLGRLSRAFGHTTRAPRGVRRFRSIEELDAQRTAWESGPPAQAE